jgi:hypothetical protein
MSLLRIRLFGVKNLIEVGAVNPHPLKDDIFKRGIFFCNIIYEPKYAGNELGVPLVRDNSLEGTQQLREILVPVLADFLTIEPLVMRADIPEFRQRVIRERQFPLTHNRFLERP